MKEEINQKYNTKQQGQFLRKKQSSSESKRFKKDKKKTIQHNQVTQMSSSPTMTESSKKQHHKKIMRRIGFKPTVKAFSKVCQKSSRSKKDNNSRQSNNFICNIEQSSNKQSSENPQYIYQQKYDCFFNDNKKKLKRIGRKVWVSAYKKTVIEQNSLQKNIDRLCQQPQPPFIQVKEYQKQPKESIKIEFNQFKQEQIAIKFDRIEQEQLARRQQIQKINKEQQDIQRSYIKKLIQFNHSIYSQKFINQKINQVEQVKKQQKLKYVNQHKQTQYDTTKQRQISQLEDIINSSSDLYNRSICSETLEMQEAASIIEQQNDIQNKSKILQISNQSFSNGRAKTRQLQCLLQQKQNQRIKSKQICQDVYKFYNKDQLFQQQKQGKIENKGQQKTFYKVKISQIYRANNLDKQNSDLKTGSFQIEDNSQNQSRQISELSKQQNIVKNTTKTTFEQPSSGLMKVLNVKPGYLNTPSQCSQDESCEISSKGSEMKSECTFCNREIEPKPSFLSQNMQFNSQRKQKLDKKPLSPAYPFIQNILTGISGDNFHLNPTKNQQSYDISNSQIKSPAKSSQLSPTNSKPLNKHLKVNKEKLAEYQPKKMSYSAHTSTSKIGNKQNKSNKSKISASLHNKSTKNSQNDKQINHKSLNKRFEIHKYISEARKEIQGTFRGE